MSKVGKRILKIPNGVNVEIEKDKNNPNFTYVLVKGPLGELKKQFLSKILIEQKDGELFTKKFNDDRQTKMLCGTYNSLLQGMLKGVSEGFSKELEIIGVGYNAKLKEKNAIELTLGYSHKIIHRFPSELKIELKSPTELKISGIDKQLVGLHASIVKKYKKPEPYGGKGIKYKGEFIRRKVGKAASK